ncbi:heparan sulfate 6-O-sulfotransferase [Oratosquilla oratoria]|uniref:heparan sulfate 6-O-sulfotransferase n=1 Tax=Oratosquilla oratoria TaxID=337810 RepID=UPI003F7669FE
MVLVNTEVQTDDCKTELLISDSDSGSKRRSVRSQNSTSSVSESISEKKGGWMSVKKCLCLLCVLIAFGGIGILYLGYFCPESVCTISWKSLSKPQYEIINDGIDKFHISSDQVGKPVDAFGQTKTGPSFDDVLKPDFQFDIKGHDVIVFLHIQKTGGTTFGKHLVKDLALEKECRCHRKRKKRCTCLRPGSSSETWLFSRYSTGWKCGLHADWTELVSCVDEVMDKIDNKEIKRRYFYITFLRNPVLRYLSEFRHVRRGATWKTAKLVCNGRPATKEEVPLCYTTDTWENVTLEEFLACPSNLAINRQTRMLADLTLVGCYNNSLMSQEERDTVMLLSAKNNLKKMAFFGLTELQEISQYLFEETFNFKFSVRFEQYNETNAKGALSGLEPETVEDIRRLNHLDMKLYEYARTLLQDRFKKLSSQDNHFQEHFNHMGKFEHIPWNEIEREN